MNVHPLSDRKRSAAHTQADETPAGRRYILWIDQVGAILLCPGERTTIGGPVREGRRSDVAMMANLSRRHATFVRSGEGFLLEPHAPVSIAGRPVFDRVDLADGCKITLGANVVLRCRVPSAMSGTVRLDFESEHRAVLGVDAVVLMQDVCLLGATSENHVVCPGWPETVMLFRRDGELWCRSRGDLFIDGQHAPAGGKLTLLRPEHHASRTGVAGTTVSEDLAADIMRGTLVCGADFRFRLEAIEADPPDLPELR